MTKLLYSTIKSSFLLAVFFIPSVASWNAQSLFRSKLSSCHRQCHNELSLLVLSQTASDNNDNGQTNNKEEEGEVKVLLPSMELNNGEDMEETIIAKTDPTTAASSSPPLATPTSIMITRDMKRILIEELGYKRRDVDRLRPEMAPAIVSKRLKCPSDGMPSEWAFDDDFGASSSSMVDRLEQESQYPLKFPLLGISLILFGKGLSDAAITLIKVNIDFPGVSLSEQFMGVPVLGIDAICVILGGALGTWTWKTMQ